MLEIKQRIKESPVGFLAENVRDLFTQNGKYNRQTVQVMRRVLKPDSSCIDIGAHLGSVLKDIVAISPQGQHFAFEPLPHLAERLRQKFPTVKIFENALSDRTGHTTFQYVTNSPAYSGLKKRIYDRSVKIQEIEVDMVRLDDVIPEQAAIALIKLDIEGGEYHALQGALATIHRCQPVIVFEASIGSTGQYGVEPDMLYALVTEIMEYQISTMERWLQAAPGYDIGEFRKNWVSGPEFYFIAYP